MVGYSQQDQTQAKSNDLPCHARDNTGVLGIKFTVSVSLFLFQESPCSVKEDSRHAESLNWALLPFMDC